MFKPIKETIPKLKVKKMWLVTVKVYGIIPKKLQKKIKTNVVKTKGKNFSPFFESDSNNIPWTKKNICSDNICQLFGKTVALCKVKWKKTNIKEKTKKRKNDEFVKANLLPIIKEKIGTISNCSKGEKSIIDIHFKKARSGFEPLFKDLQSKTLPIMLHNTFFRKYY